MSNLAKLPAHRPATIKLPEYIYNRMVQLKLRPSFSALAELTGVSRPTLYDNFSCKTAMSAKTAWLLAEILEISTDDLLENIEWV